MKNLKKISLALTALTAGFAGSVSAAVPLEVTDGAASLAADIPLYGAAFIGVAIASVLAGAGLKWTKRFGNKAT